EDYALLLFKADKSTTYTKTGDDALLLLKADKSTTYTKTEDDALLLLKADKTQLIDSYSKSETYARDEVYIKGEADNLLNSKANQSTTYTKIETDYIISYIDVGDVDLSGYMTLGTSQTINANKTFNNACRFVSTIDGMPIVTGSSFVKSSVDNTVVLLGAGGTKPISEFTTTIDDSNYVKKDGDVQDIQGIIRKTSLNQPYPEPTDDDYVTLGAVKSEFVSSIYSGSINGNLTANQFIKSGGTDQQVLLANGITKPISEFAGCPTDLSNYYTKAQTFSQTESNNKFVRLEGSIQQTLTGTLKYVSPFGGTYDETQDPVENTYLTQSEVDAKLTNVVTTNTTQSITGAAKTFNSNVNATGFAKTGKDDTSVLLAGGGDMLLSAFGGLELVNINYTSNVVSPTSIMSLKCYRYGSLINFYGYIYMGNGAGASGAAVAVCTLESAGFPKYLFYADDIVFAGSAPHVANFRFGTDGKVTISIKVLSGTAGLAGAASAYINVTYPAAN
ncbi:MAG: hypothetical protein EZS28_019608, partial [Streblomastix strix]